MSFKKLFICSALCVLCPAVVSAQGQNPPQETLKQFITAPQGYPLDTLKSLDAVQTEGDNDQLVMIRGRFTKKLSSKTYEFRDFQNNRIVCNLSDDHHWKGFKLNQGVEILAEINKDTDVTQLDVIEIHPVP